MSENQRWCDRDSAVLWHSHQWEDVANPLLPIESADGVWLTDFDGRKYLDATSSGGTKPFGHNHPQINDALRDQLSQLDQVDAAGLIHQPAIELAERLTQLAPPGLERVLYSQTGRSAVSQALELSLLCWRNSGHNQRRYYVRLSRSDLSRSDFSNDAAQLLHSAHHSLTTESLLLEPIVAPSPDDFSCAADISPEAHALAMFERMQAILSEHGEQICAVVIEPLVQNGRLRMYHPAYLNQLNDACANHHVHLIIDETIVGCGRTGTLFACEQANLSPDFLCLGDSLNNGSLPFATLLTTERIREAVGSLESPQPAGPALACRAALAVLDIFETEPVLEHIRTLTAAMAQRLAPLKGHPGIAQIRQRGMIGAIEIHHDSASDNLGQRAAIIRRHGIEHGVLLAATDNVVYFMPPFVINVKQIQLIVDVAAAAIEEAIS